MVVLLKVGSRGAEVARLQELLNKHLQPSPRLKIDGLFGSRTEAAVRYYQIAVGIGIDGVVGDRTWSALKMGLLTELASQRELCGNFCNAPWMEVARKEIGQDEIAGIGDNPRILTYHASTALRASTDETPWCSSFVNWCLKEVGILGTNSAAATSWVHWGKASAPVGGAITIICSIDVVSRSFSPSRGHVGFLVEDSCSHYNLLGGNQRNSVKKSMYPKSSWGLLGHRWPREEEQI